MYHVVLEEELTIYQAAQLHARCRDALKEHNELLLDFSRVQEVDCSIVQVVLWLQAEARLQHKRLLLSHYSAALIEFLQLTGFVDLLKAEAAPQEGS